MIRGLTLSLVFSFGLVLYFKLEEVDWLEKELSRTKNEQWKDQLLIRDQNQKIKELEEQVSAGKYESRRLEDHLMYKSNETLKLERSLSDTTIELKECTMQQSEHLSSCTNYVYILTEKLHGLDKNLSHKLMETQQLKDGLVKETETIVWLKNEIDEMWEQQDKLINLVASNSNGSCKEMIIIISKLVDELTKCHNKKPEEESGWWSSWWENILKCAEFVGHGKSVAKILCAAGVKIFCFV